MYLYICGSYCISIGQHWSRGSLHSHRGQVKVKLFLRPYISPGKKKSKLDKQRAEVNFPVKSQNALAVSTSEPIPVLRIH